MNGAKTLTHILFPVFVGFIIGGAVSGSTSFLVWGIILLVLDIIVGIIFYILSFTMSLLIMKTANLPPSPLM